MITVVCLKCNKTSFAVSKQYAENEIKHFNDYYYSQPKETQDLFAGPSSVDNYKCIYCNGDQFKPGNTAPDGSTLNPVIYQEEI